MSLAIIDQDWTSGHALLTDSDSMSMPLWCQHRFLFEETARRLLDRVACFILDPKSIWLIAPCVDCLFDALIGQFGQANYTCSSVFNEILAHECMNRGITVCPSSIDTSPGLIPAQDATQDLLIMNVSPWNCWQLDSFLHDAMRVLCAEGVLLYALFGVDTGCQLRQAMDQACQPTNMMIFPDMHDVGDKMQALGFHEVVVEREVIDLQYESFKDLQEEWRALGWSFLFEEGDASLQLIDWEAVEKHYPRENGAYIFHVELITAHALKPVMTSKQLSGGEFAVNVSDIKRSTS